MPNRKRPLLFSIILLCWASAATAQITSTFDTNTEGWTLINDGDNDTIPVVHNAGEYVSGVLPADTYPGYFWYAPAKFLGNLAYYSYGKTLSFDLQQLVTGNNSEFNGNYYEAYNADVEITNGVNSIYFHTSPKPALSPSWSTYTITLSTASAWRNGQQTASALCSANEIKTVLSSVTAVMIRANYNLTANTVGLDNVSLGRRTYYTAPIVSSFAPTSGLPGTTITIDGSDFDPDPAQNAVFFGSANATISSATSTQLMVIVPSNAEYGPITVINKNKGVVTQSQDPFVPVFTGGGRIIPASLDNKIEISLDATPGNNINGLILGDIDGDGWLDLIVSQSSLNEVAIFRNLGITGDVTAASFAPKVSVTGSGNQPGLRLYDLDGDGKLDIVSEFANASVTMFATLRNTSTPGNISFETRELWPGLVYSGTFSNVADLDGDGLAELMGTHGNGSASPDFWVAQNISTKGDIEFSVSKSFFGSSTLDAACGVSTGDFDNDGKTDVIVTHSFCGMSKLLRNTSTPGAISFDTPFTITDGVHGRVVVADFNNDGKRDIAWKKGFSNDDINIRLNNYAGGVLSATDFSPAIIINSDLSNYGSMSIADFNGDGKPDILATDGSYMGIFENVYTGGVFDNTAFVTAHIYQAAGQSTYPTGVLAGDLNGDLKPELLIGITNVTPPRVYIYENKNVHTPVISVNTVSPLAGAVGSTVTITGDHFSTTPADNIVHFGGVKAVVQTATKNTLTVTVPPGASIAPVSVTRNDLTARYHLPFVPTFSAGVIFDGTTFLPPVSFVLTTADYDIAVADVNNDGKPDVLAEGVSGRSYSFLNTHTTGSISSSSLAADDSTNSSAQNPHLVDIDEDGMIDILSINGIYKNISTTGEIAFEPLVSVSAGSNHSWGDFNMDGKTDFVGVNGTLATLSENLTRPGSFTTGTFPSLDASITYSKPATGGGSASADFDKDGDVDFVATNPGTDNITVWQNNSAYRITTTQFTALPVITVGDNPGRIYTGDLDVDGKVDLMLYYSTTTTSQFVTVLHNESTPGNISFSRSDYNIGAFATVAHISDLDGDGKPEILVNSETTDKFFILKNTSTPGVINASSFAAPFATTVNNPRGLSSGDLNLDGKPEIIISSAPNSLLVFENAVPTGPVIVFSVQPSPASVCAGGASTIFTALANGTTNIAYRWQIFNNGSGVYDDLSDNTNYSGVNTNTLTVNTTGSLSSGNYRVRASGDLASDAFSDPATLTVNALPTQPGTSGATSCVSPTTLNLIASGTSNGNYRWYDAATGGTVLGTNNTFSTPSITNTTIYHVSIADAFCESLRTPVTATISLLPKPIIAFNPPAASGTINLCDGAAQGLTAPAGFSSYTWSDGQTTQTISIDESGVYSIIVEDALGCISPSSDPVTIVVNPFPVATITPTGDQLTASPADNYQWYNLGEAITDATNQTLDINVLEYGVYAVDVTSNGCTTRSDDYTYLITDVEDKNNSVRIYPNPVVEKLNIEAKQNVKQVELTDMLGRTISTFNSKVSEIDVQHLSPGVYLVMVTLEKRKITYRIFKSR
jgi:hypothetical protein